MEIVASNGLELPNAFSSLQEGPQDLPSIANKELFLQSDEVNILATAAPLQNGHDGDYCNITKNDGPFATTASIVDAPVPVASMEETEKKDSKEVTTSSVNEEKSIEEQSKLMNDETLKANEEMLPDDDEKEFNNTTSQIEEEMDTQSEQNYLQPSTNGLDLHESSNTGSYQISPSTLSDSDRPSSSLVTDSVKESLSREPSESISPEKSISCLNIPPVDKPTLPAPSGIASFSLTSFDVPENGISTPLNMSAYNFPKRHRHVHRAAVYAMHPYHRATCRGGPGVGVAKTLDLLKAVLQTSFNQEMKRLCDEYLNVFSIAATNINENTGDHIPDSTLKLLVCKMLDEAQQGYQNGKWEFPSGQLPKNDRVSDYKGSPMSTKKSRNDKDVRHQYGNKRGRKPSEKVIENSRSAWRWSLDKRRLDPGKWSIDKLSHETKFVLGVNVNKALGHAANRGKVYILHPELFKYVCDGDDKTWLYDNKYLPVHGGKAFLLIYDEVEALVKAESSYKDNPDILKSVQKLQRFSVPQFIENKMKEFIKNVQGYFAQENAASSSGMDTDK